MFENNKKKETNFFLDRLTSDNEEIKSRRDSIISDFNLEFQKIKAPPNNHAKFTKEFKKLVELVKESNIYRDINGNRIIKKGKLLLTPFQKLRKINDEIKIYYDNKIHKKNSQLIIKNFLNKREQLDKKIILNTERRKINLIKQKIISKPKNSNFDQFKEAHSKTMNKFNLRIKMNKELKPIIKSKEKSKTTDFQNFLCLKNSANKKCFNVSEFNQINIWRAKVIKFDSLNKTNYLEKRISKSLNDKKYITEYNNKNKKKLNNSLRKTINIKKMDRNKMWIESKTIEEANSDKCKYKLLQFNLHQLIKPSSKYKGKIILNIKSFNTDNKNNDYEETKDDIIKKENKIISVNMDEIESKV